MKIVLIVAGMSDPSNSHMLADAFVAGIKQHSAHAKIAAFRLKDLRIAHFSLDHYTNADAHTDDYVLIENEMRQSHALVIASPVWNFSVPAHLKNFIDRLGAYALDAQTHSVGMLRGMPVYFLYTGGAPAPAWKSMLALTTSHMRESLRYFGASIVGTHFEGRCTLGKGVFTLVVDSRPDTLSLLQQKGFAFARIVERFSQTGTLPLRYRFSYAFFRFCYAVVNKVAYAFS